MQGDGRRGCLLNDWTQGETKPRQEEEPPGEGLHQGGGEGAEEAVPAAGTFVFLATRRGLVKKTPLEARVTGSFERAEYRVEKIVFQSMPGLYVTGNLYVPKTRAGRLPAVLDAIYAAYGLDWEDAAAPLPQALQLAGWLAERLRAFVDGNPEFETAVERLATWLARDED